MKTNETLALLEEHARSGCAALLGIRFTAADGLTLVAEMEVGQEHLAPNGRVHGGVITTLADTACGNGTIARLAGRADRFATVELSTHFLRSPTSATLTCRAHLVHEGRRIHHWTAEVYADGEVCARFRCTQLVEPR